MPTAADALLLPGAAELARLHAAELPQKDELCGCFWTLLALRLAGIEGPDGEPLDQDAVGRAAGSGGASEDDYAESLPPGEHGRRDYRLELPAVAADVAGTSAGGLVRAVGELSDGRRTAVPVAGPWTPALVDTLLDLAAGEQEAALVLNVATGLLWGSHPSAAQLLGYLATGDDDGPEPDWAVGHFVGCFGSVRGPGGSLVLIGDTYPSLGVGGVHAQPRERVAAALTREGMTPGGALVIVPAERAEAVSGALREAGFELRVWDNGSVDLRAG